MKRGKSEGVRARKPLPTTVEVLSESEKPHGKRRSRHLQEPGATTQTSRSPSSSSSRTNSKEGSAENSRSSSPTNVRGSGSSSSRKPSALSSRAIPGPASRVKPPSTMPTKTMRLGQRVTTPSSLRPPSIRETKGKDTVRRRMDMPVSATGIPLRKPSGLSAGSRVGAIAKHFDKLNAEQRERQRRASRRARPITQVRSSVQTFSSMRAAVQEDWDDEDGPGEAQEDDDADDDADDEEEAGGAAKVDEDEEGGGGQGNASTSVESSSTKATPPLDSKATSATPSDVPEPSEHVLQAAQASPPEGRSIPPSLPTSPRFNADTFALPSSRMSHLSESEMSSSDTSKHSLMKTIANLWRYQSADFLPLEYPQLSTEHQSAENPVVLREDEPSSMIAYTLASKIYQVTLQETVSALRILERPEAFMPEDDIGHSLGRNDRSQWGMIDMTSDIMDHDEGPKPLPTKPMQFRFDLEPCTITCKIFFMHHFDALRKDCGVNSTFIESLARCIKWDSSGGKSGQTFLKTKDDRFIIKTISKVELEAMTKFAPAYFEHLDAAKQHGRPTMLAKMFGIFQISFVNKSTGTKGKLQVQIQENLWAEKSSLKIYDLKGLTRNRTATVTGKPNEVLLDGNFIEMCRSAPLYVHETSLLRLQASLFNDTVFLSRNNVMDYSLVIGIDQKSEVLHVGIIDYLRIYSWDKRLETLVKELGSSKEAPTIVTPLSYASRFRSAMARYFSLSPDAWLAQWRPFLVKTDPSVDPKQELKEAKTANEQFVLLPRADVFRVV